MIREASGERSGSDRHDEPRPVAVIDIGASAVRMSIAEIDGAGGIRILERLVQGVSLGKDTFPDQVIRKSTIEECVRVLKSYRQKLDEYRIASPDQIRVVATSAVREARNRVAFLDRVYGATGFLVESIEEAEVSRITFLGIRPLLRTESVLESAATIVTEVGGGSTEVLLLRSGNVEHSQTYRLGSLRLRETLDAFQAPRGQERKLMEVRINYTIGMIREHVPTDCPVELLALGGDIRFAAARLLDDWSSEALSRLPLSQLEEFTDEVLAQSDDQLMQRYNLTLTDAETLGPALLTYVHMARAFGLEHVLITGFSLGDALLSEMATEPEWSDEFRSQIIRSAVDIGRKFDIDEPHARHVAELSSRLFEQLRDEHKLERRFELLLYVAALLHEAGLYISTRGFHKHSMYLINNSEIFGLNSDEQRIVALVARYHRRATPKPAHNEYGVLDRDNRIAVSRLAAILRIADSLDHSRSGRIAEPMCHISDGQFVISTSEVDDLSLEQLELRQNSSLFEEVFGLPVLLRSAHP